MDDPLPKRIGAEFLGTFVLVFGGCGTAVITANFGPTGIGILGVALAFGLTVLIMAYAVGNVSGGHFNPAVTIGLMIARRFPGRDVAAYIITQVVAAIAAAVALWIIAHGQKGFSSKQSGFAANGYGDHSPGHYSLWAVLIAEILLTCIFVYVILGATDRRATAGFGGLAIGLTLTLDSPGQHSDRQHLGEPGPVDRSGAVRRRLGHRPGVGVPGRAGRGCGHRRSDVLPDRWWSGPRAARECADQRAPA